MRTLSSTALLTRSMFAAGTVVAVASAFAIGCSSSSTTTTTDSGTSSTSSGSSATKASSSSSSKKDAGTSSSKSDAGTSSSTKPSDAGKSDAPVGDAGTLYTRLGGHAGILAAVHAVVTAELANADIASYFFFQAGAPANGHPTRAQIEECFTDLLGSIAGGTETYPATVVSEAGSYTCRSLANAHSNLSIDQGTFATFVTIAAGELTTLGVKPADLATIGGALEASEGLIVTLDGGVHDAGDAAQLFPGSIDAASKVDAF